MIAMFIFEANGSPQPLDQRLQVIITYRAGDTTKSFSLDEDLTGPVWSFVKTDPGFLLEGIFVYFPTLTKQICCLFLFIVPLLYTKPSFCWFVVIF